MFKLKFSLVLLGMVALPAWAGPFILAGTDADDHGFASGGANQDGWFFMQRALENIGAGVTNGNNVVAVLGSTSSSASAANSAFDLSSLTGTGWSRANVASASFADFFGGVSATNISNVGILIMDSGGNVSGGVSGALFSPYAAAIDSFVGGGGGLFSQANGYEWLTTLLPAVSTTSEFASGITLTAAGTAAFPGLTNADLSAGPYHNSFNNFSPIPVLGVGASGNALIIGGTGGSITNPGNPGTALPEPATVALLGFGIAAIGAMRRRKA